MILPNETKGAVRREESHKHSSSSVFTRSSTSISSSLSSQKSLPRPKATLGVTESQAQTLQAGDSLAMTPQTILLVGEPVTNIGFLEARQLHIEDLTNLLEDHDNRYSNIPEGMAKPMKNPDHIASRNYVEADSANLSSSGSLEFQQDFQRIGSWVDEEEMMRMTGKPLIDEWMEP